MSDSVIITALICLTFAVVCLGDRKGGRNNGNN